MTEGSDINPKYLALLLAAFPTLVLAGGEKHIPEQSSQHTLSQYETQSQQANPMANAGASQNQSSALDDHSRSTAIALGNGAPPPPQCPPGLVPGKHGKRGLYVGFVGLSALCTAPDESQALAMAKAHADEVELAKLRIEAARAEAERDRAATARIQAESCRESCARK